MKKISITAIFSILLIISFFFDNAILNLVKTIKVNEHYLEFIFGVIVIGFFYLMLSIYFFIKDRKWLVPFWSSIFVSSVMCVILKLIIARPRLYGAKFYPLLGLHDFSFPSLHTVLVFSALPILFFRTKRFRWLWLIYASFVGLSRLLLKEHYISDAIAGILLAFIIGEAIVYMEQKHKMFSKFKLDLFEFKRGILHFLLGALIIILLYYEILTPLILFIVLVIGVVMSIISKKYQIPVLYWFLQQFDREKDLKRFPGKGVVFYILGSLIVVLSFQKVIAMASIAILALADPVSRFVGIHFGKIKHPFSNVKFFEGAIGGFMFGFLGAVIFISPIEAFFASFFAMVAEGVEIKSGLEKVDDNIIIPVVAGVVVWLLRFWGLKFF